SGLRFFRSSRAPSARGRGQPKKQKAPESLPGPSESAQSWWCYAFTQPLAPGMGQVKYPKKAVANVDIEVTPTLGCGGGSKRALVGLGSVNSPPPSSTRTRRGRRRSW